MSSPAPARGRRSKFPAILLAGLLVVAGGLAAYFALFRPKPTPPIHDHEGAVAANLRGIGHLERREYEKAQKEFEEAVRLDADWVPARVNLGISLLNQQPSETKALAKPTEQAKQVLSEVLTRDPENKHAHYCIGLIEQYIGHLAEAYEQYVVVNRLDPNDPHTWLRLGACHPNGPQSAEAGQCFEKALKIDPYLNEARYRLFQVVNATDADRAKNLLDEFNQLRAADWETGSSLEKFGEQGKYAQAIGGELTGNSTIGPVPVFDTPPGFQVTLAAGARWATAADLDPLRKAARERFGGTIVLFDFNGDGRPDLFLVSAVVQDGKVRDLLLRNDGDFKWTDVTAAAGLATPRVSLGAAAADYDNDGHVDLVITGAGEQHLFRNKGDSTFEDVSAVAGLDKVTGVCLGCGWADLDQDGDLDLIICRYAESPDAAAGFAGTANNGGGIVLLENVGEARPARPNTPFPAMTTRFKPNEALAKPVGACAAVAVVIADFDGDHDLDVLVLADGADPILIENDRLLRFRRATPAWTTGHGNRFNGGLVFVATHAPRPDLLLTRPDKPPVFLTPSGTKDYTVVNTGAATWRQAVTVDVDLDGWADAVGLSAHGPALLHNQGDARLEYKTGALGLPESFPKDAFAVASTDLNGDCNPDLLLWSDAGLTVRRNAGNGNHSLGINPTGRKDVGTFMRSNASGIGCRVVAKCATHWAAAERNTAAAGLGQSLLPLSLGMGKHEVADAVEVLWPDGIVQVELAMPAQCGQNLPEFSRKSTSCPVLLTWDGERFVFITDFLGAGSMGELAADGSTRPPRPEESVKIESRMLKLKDGHYVLKIAEPMDEVCFLDHLRLDVVDHPAGVAVFPDERFATSDPQPTQELLTFHDRRFPKKANDHRGNDVTKLLLERDRRAPDGFEVRSWLGFAEDHHLTLSFGELPAGKNWHLVLAGWTEYPYPESIYAAERAGVPLQFPVLERLAADGKTWESLGELGFPAGLPRVMTRPLPDLKLGPCTLRIRTNMQIYWDQVYLAQATNEGINVHSLKVARADLAMRGFMQEIHPDGRPPLAYDDSKTESIPIGKWNGKLTRTGDVTELLTAADDRFVVFGPGDEVTVRFDASKLPPVPAGWERSFVLRTRGYSKDTAPFTATGGTVEPLPFQAMKNYPDFGGAVAPATDAAKWNTRPVGGR